MHFLSERQIRNLLMLLLISVLVNRTPFCPWWKFSRMISEDKSMDSNQWEVTALGQGKAQSLKAIFLFNSRFSGVVDKYLSSIPCHWELAHSFLLPVLLTWQQACDAPSLVLGSGKTSVGEPSYQRFRVHRFIGGDADNTH